MSRSNPARRIATVTPSDSTEFTFAVSGIYVGTTGHVAVTTASGDTETFLNFPSGQILPVQALKVLSTGTTATNMVAMGQ